MSRANAYLYTWNPLHWSWVDLSDAIYRINNGKPYPIRWSCGNTKKIQIGDVFFLMRLGEDPKGIIACGYVGSAPQALPHWDAEKQAAGLTALRTDMQFRILAEKPMLSLALLEREFPNVRWTPQASAMSLPHDVAQSLMGRLQELQQFDFSEPVAEVLCLEGAPKEITLTTYDRSPLARQLCITQHGHKCSVCGFSFKDVYGDWGATYIEVHHLKPISEFAHEHLIDPVNDLRPVCANCHRMLHRDRPVLSIEELQKKIKSVSRFAEKS
jgi:5-methylcytosine-specific restriction protein A